MGQHTKKLFRKLITSLAVLTLFLSSVLPASALTVDGDTTGGTGSSDWATGGYSIGSTWTNDSTAAIAYRFSVYNIYSKESSRSIDIFRSAYSGYRSYHKMPTKYNKVQYATGYKGFATDFDTVTSYSSTNVFLETATKLDGMAALPTNTGGMDTWGESEYNVNAVLNGIAIADKNGDGSITYKDLKSGDRILVEPIYPATIADDIVVMTPTEMAFLGAIALGEDTVPNPVSGDTVTWNFISRYTNRWFPQSLYLDEALKSGGGTTIIPAESALTANATFKEVITGG